MAIEQRDMVRRVYRPVGFSAEQLTQLLRNLDRPAQLAHQLNVPVWRGRELRIWITTAISMLEHSAVERPTNVRGSVLRMCYLEWASPQTICWSLGINAQQFTRLHAEGLAWLGTQLRRHLADG